MPRKKKDGRFINYYIDRGIYERLERYADDKGQQMTTAIERILDSYLSQYESAQSGTGGTFMYCSNCCVLTEGSVCPVCGNRPLRLPREADYCYLCEIETIWVDALKDVLRDNQIPFAAQNVLGAGLAAKIGPAMERARFFVPYVHYETAKSLYSEFLIPKY